MTPGRPLRAASARTRRLVASLAVLSLIPAGLLGAQTGRADGAAAASGVRSGQGRPADAPRQASRAGTRTAASRGPVQCEKCHADRQFLAGKAKGAKGDSVLFVPDTLLRDSRHQTLVCADCHAGYNDGYPHVQVAAVSVSCTYCHADQEAAYEASIHAPNFVKSGDAPTCASCHSSHRVLGSDDPRSPTYPLNVARLCGSCHAKASIIDAYFNEPVDSTARTAVRDFRRSVHGLAITGAGLTVSATCSDCHDAHRVLPHDSTASTLSRANVKATCGACHAGVLATYDSSAHGQALAAGDTTDTGKSAPVCIECHGGHKAVEADDPVWFSGVVQECGACHARLLDTYFNTYHGKASALGYGIAAKCSDCHTAHAMLAADDANSSVHPDRLVETCGACHEGANANFVKYMPHGDPHDRERNPELYWVWLFMTTLLVGVFSFFGAHSLLWFARLMRERKGGHGGGHGARPSAVTAEGTVRAPPPSTVATSPAATSPVATAPVATSPAATAPVATAPEAPTPAPDTAARESGAAGAATSGASTSAGEAHEVEGPKAEATGAGDAPAPPATDQTKDDGRNA